MTELKIVFYGNLHRNVFEYKRDGENFTVCIILLFFFSLGPLVNKVKEFQVETIVDTLCSNMISDKEQLRDISSIGQWFY